MKELDLLKRSPMFQLSLSSKELFHSNFLYWLSLIDRDKFAELINKLIQTTNIEKEWSTDWEVKREYKHFDLCITSGAGKNEVIHLVLENKFKSIPDCGQLAEYLEKAKKSKHILLTLVDEFPEKEKIEGSWEVINYDGLSTAMRQVYHHYTGYVAEIIKDYIGFISAFHNLASSWNIEPGLPFSNNIGQYCELRINDVYQKIIYSKLLAAIVRELGLPVEHLSDPHKIFSKTMEKSKGFIFVNSGLTNSQGLLELKVRVNEDTILLIQLQGRQYRRCVEIKPRKRRDLESNRKWLCEKAPEGIRDLFSFSDKAEGQPKRPYPEGLSNNKNPFRKHKVTDTNNKVNGFCKYGNCFIYQYVVIDDNVTVGTIIKAIVEDIRYFMSIAD